jgi:hypothetical protein
MFVKCLHKQAVVVCTNVELTILLMVNDSKGNAFLIKHFPVDSIYNIVTALSTTNVVPLIKVFLDTSVATTFPRLSMMVNGPEVAPDLVNFIITVFDIT